LPIGREDELCVSRLTVINLHERIAQLLYISKDHFSREVFVGWHFNDRVIWPFVVVTCAYAYGANGLRLFVGVVMSVPGS